MDKKSFLSLSSLEKEIKLYLIDGTEIVSANIKQNMCLKLISLFQSIQFLFFLRFRSRGQLFSNPCNKLVTCIDAPLSIHQKLNRHVN